MTKTSSTPISYKRYIDIPEFMRYVNDGLMVVQSHPSKKLCIWNYSRKAQWERVWTPETRMARGLITTDEGAIVARPFEKFFNLGEHMSYDMPLPIGEPIEVSEKLDGSLGILYPNGDDWRCPYALASRGSFTSPQALKGTELLKSYWPNDSCINPDWTYLFEILYPENRIVIKYPVEGLVLLAIRDTLTGGERTQDTVFARPPSFKFHTSDDLYKAARVLGDDEANREGVVIRFLDSNVRVKVKFNEYVRLHKLLTGLTARDVWDALRLNKPLKLEDVPDEFDAWVKQTELRLMSEFKRIADHCLRLFHRIDLSDWPRPLFANWTNTLSPKLRPVMFRLYDGKRYDDIIWKLVKPEAGDVPFKKEEEDGTTEE